jgi:hypothetical protein
MRMARLEVRPTCHEPRGVAGEVAAREPVELVEGDRPEIAHPEMVRGIDLRAQEPAGDRRKVPVVPVVEGEVARAARVIVVRCDQENEAKEGGIPPRHLP